MLLGTGLCVLLFGCVTMPFFSHGGVVTPTTLIFMAGLSLIGFHASKEVAELRLRSKVIARTYQAAPVVLPALALLIRQVAR